jgi:ABC-type iron transport system FetAB permease component
MGKIMLSDAFYQFLSEGTYHTARFLEEAGGGDGGQGGGMVRDPEADGDSGSSSTPLSLVSILLALLCPLGVMLISYHLKLDMERQILISVGRTIVQLLLAGFLLLGLIFSLQSPIAVFGYLLLMGLIAALEVTSRQVRTYVGHYGDSLTAVMLGGAGIGIFGSIFVFNPTPWWNPHVMVPTCGMIIGNAISGPALAVDRYEHTAVVASMYRKLFSCICTGY